LHFTNLINGIISVSAGLELEGGDVATWWGEKKKKKKKKEKETQCKSQSGA